MDERLRTLGVRLTTPPASLRRLAGRVAGLLGPLRPYRDRVVAYAKPAVESARAFYERREPREKLLLRMASGLIAVLLAYNLLYAPIAGLRETLADNAVTRRQDLIDIHGLMHTYDHMQAELSAAQRRTVPSARNFSLFTIVEQTLTNSVGRERIGSIAPADHPVTGGFRQYTVDVKLNAVSLRQVVDVLYGVQSLSMPVTVANLEMRPHAADSHSFDVTLTCMALGKDG